MLRVEGPKGTFHVRDTDRPLIFLATGTGIAPIFAMLSAIDDKALPLRHPIEVYWGVRHRESFFPLPKFHYIDIKVNKVLSKPDPDWQGSSGYIQDIALPNYSPEQAVHVYACGSDKMIQSAKDVFVNKGLPKNAFFYDIFLPNQ